MIAMGNRVFLRRGCHSFFSHGELCHFIATSFESRMLACALIHRPNDDVLLSFSFLLDGVHKLFCHPIRKGLVAIGDFSAKVEGPKGGHVATLEVFVVCPVGRSDLALKNDEL